MPKLYKCPTLESVLRALNDGRRIARGDVRPSLLRAKVWQGFYGMGGGYMPDNDSRYYARSKREVVDAHCESVRMFDDYALRAPRGFRRDLMRYGSAESRDGRATFEIAEMTVCEALG